jgi:hypothetical protein
MRYWAYFVAKLAAAGGVLYGLLVLINHSLPKGRVFPIPDERSKMLAPLEDSSISLAFNLVLAAWFILAGVALFFIIRDQRYRCRVCLRRLRMPVETGSWGRMLLSGRPRVEYICPYGHGTLRAEEVQISGLVEPEWTPQSGDIWDELCSTIVKEDPKAK